MRGSREFPGLSRTAFELEQILRRDPDICSICRHVGRGVDQFIDTMFYELVNDEPTREKIRDARGFCRFHARLISQHADALGTAIIMNDVLTNDARDIEAGKYDHPPGSGGPLSRLFDGARTAPSRSICPLCTVESDMEDTAIDALLEAIALPAFLELFRSTAGLCMSHFRLAFERGPDNELWRAIRETQLHGLTELAAQLQELARKYDYRFAHESKDAEAGSWRRALNVSSGRIHK